MKMEQLKQEIINTVNNLDDVEALKTIQELIKNYLNKTNNKSSHNLGLHFDDAAEPEIN
jgi:hypothetical protein